MDFINQEILEMTLSASNEGIWDWDIASGAIYYSDRALEFLGFSEKDAPNLFLDPACRIHPNDLELFQSKLTKAIERKRDNTPFSIDKRVLAPSAPVRWLRFRGIIKRDTEGAPLRMVGSVIDISKRKRAEKKTREERNMLRLIIDHVPLQVFFKDTESRYVLVNNRQAKWVGAETPEDLIGKTMRDFFSEESWKESRREELKIMEKGISIIGQIWNEHWNDHEDTYVRKTKKPWYSRTGELLGTYGLSYDVTDLVIAQKKLETLALSLNKKNRQFAEELSLARELQNALLPERTADWQDKIRHFGERIEFGHLYVPASALAGDYYDIIPLDADRAGVLIFDVMGHGVRSSLIVTLIRGIIEQSPDTAGDPAIFLGSINQTLCQLFQRAGITIFVTACYCVIDTKARTIDIASAGHDFPFMQYTSAESPPTFKNSKALGIFPEASFEGYQLPLDSVSRMLFFTDGIYEASNTADEEWGIDNMREHFESAPSITAAIDSIYQAGQAWMGKKEFNDDVCLFGVDIHSTTR